MDSNAVRKIGNIRHLLPHGTISEIAAEHSCTPHNVRLVLMGVHSNEGIMKSALEKLEQLHKEIEAVLKQVEEAA